VADARRGDFHKDLPLAGGRGGDLGELQRLPHYLIYSGFHVPLELRCSCAQFIDFDEPRETYETAWLGCLNLA